MRKWTICWALIGGIVITGVLVTKTMLTNEVKAAESENSVGLNSDAKRENPLIDFDGHLKQALQAREVRAKRRVSEQEFLEMSQDPATLVLDARSASMYKLLHVEGAVNLPYTEFTAASLAQVIPTPETRVLIYCNNNFKNAPAAFAPKNAFVSLNINTYVALHSYGYKNVYELKPLLDRNTTQIEFAGAEVDANKSTASPTARSETP
ncbi:rhodanese-like domain-containing protein [Blastopirellula marina]|uniref:Rhodanese-related thiosulfate sulfur transferase n=1 Tax=Blastopirellula marina DSM 3645 TaxID=314230 RepID=A3ZSX2_9BACT|nr:rhodanese-like domain-containing protein [Blastopirellula marina]EAQ80398.1 rhodanese-related thiosulfate sulfur transferase [Blastopirellula marina DSM 3645]